MIVTFCNHLGWQYLRSLLEGFASRLAFGVRADLTELIKVEGIDGSRARVFHTNGITSLAQLAQTSLQDIAKILSLAVPFESGQRQGAKQEWLFGEEQMTLQEAAQLILTRAEDGVRDIMKNLGIEMDDPNFMQNQGLLKMIMRRQKRNINRILLSKARRSTKSRIGKNLTPWLKQITQPTNPVVTRCRSQGAQQNPRRRTSDIIINTTNNFRSPLIEKSMNSVRENSYNSPIINSVKENSSFISSTPICQKRPTRISIACSHISNDSSIDIFSNSIMEMSLNDRENNIIHGKSNEEEKEIEDLETSLLKVCREVNIVEDSFDQSVEFVSRDDILQPLQNVEKLEDSFDVSQVFVSKTQYPVNKNNAFSNCVVSAENDNIKNDSADIFDDSITKTTKTTKRTREIIVCQSPTVSSPMVKTRKQKQSQMSTDFYIEDVCRSESHWNTFVTKSNDKENITIVLVLNKSQQITAISICLDKEKPAFIPLTDDEFGGNVTEEQDYPSYTPCQNVSIEKRKEHIKKLLQTCTVYGFNVLPLCQSIENFLNIQVKKPICVQYLSFLALHRQGESPLSLYDLASRFAWPFNLQEIMKMGERISSCAQSFICSRLYPDLISDAITHSSKASIDLEISSIQVVANIISTGFPFSQNACRKMLTSSQKEMDDLEDECHKIAGKSFNLESPSAVSDILFNRLKISHPGGMIHGKKHLTANKEILAQIEHMHPIVSKIKKYRQIKHTITHYLRPLQSFVTNNEVIKTTFDICTATGRLLSHTPNIQNISKGEIDGISVRSLFAAKSGRIFVAADYCQLELRILAHLSGDPALLKRIAIADRDFFTDVSKEWGFPREAVKQLCYGLIYGMGVHALADSTKTKHEEATKLFDSFFSSFPKVKTFINGIKEDADYIGNITTMLKRRRITTKKGRQFKEQPVKFSRKLWSIFTSNLKILTQKS